MGKGSDYHGAYVSGRPAKQPLAGRCLDGGGAQHDKWVEEPSQPAATEKQCKKTSKAHMGGICEVGGGPCVREKIQSTEERLAAMDRTQRMGMRDKIHPEEKSEMAERTRPTGKISVNNVMQLLRYQEYRCALTGRRLTPQTASLDHIVPMNRGGEHLIENAQILHKDVNKAKGGLTNEEFISMCAEVVKEERKWANQA